MKAISSLDVRCLCYYGSDKPFYLNLRFDMQCKRFKKSSTFQNIHAVAVLRLPGADALGRPLATTF